MAFIVTPTGDGKYSVELDYLEREWLSAIARWLRRSWTLKAVVEL
ncbi:hypothetical protein ES703_13577 [subsurface metagenome]